MNLNGMLMPLKLKERKERPTKLFYKTFIATAFCTNDFIIIIFYKNTPTFYTNFNSSMNSIISFQMCRDCWFNGHFNNQANPVCLKYFLKVRIMMLSLLWWKSLSSTFGSLNDGLQSIPPFQYNRTLQIVRKHCLMPLPVRGPLTSHFGHLG